MAFLARAGMLPSISSILAPPMPEGSILSGGVESPVRSLVSRVLYPDSPFARRPQRGSLLVPVGRQVTGRFG